MDFSGNSYAVVGGHGAIGGAVTEAIGETGGVAHVLDRKNDGTVGSKRPDVAVDLADSESLNRALDEYFSQYGVPDGLVIASGLYPAKRFAEMTGQEIMRLFAINSVAPAMILSRYAKELRAAGKQGSGVVTSSKAAGVYRVGTTAYSGSKAALNAMVRSLTLETASSGLRANVIAPGYVSVGSELNPIPPAYERRILERTSENRLCAPSDLVSAYLWLLDESSYWIRGEVISIDGGSSLGNPRDEAWISSSYGGVWEAS